MEQTVAILGSGFLLSYNWLLAVWQDGTAPVEAHKTQGLVIATFLTLCNQAVFPCLPRTYPRDQNIPTFNPLYRRLKSSGEIRKFIKRPRKKLAYKWQFLVLLDFFSFFINVYFVYSKADKS